MGDHHELTTINGKQSSAEPPRTEPLAQTPLTESSPKTPQDEPAPESSRTQPQTENVPLKKAWWIQWKGAIISLAAVLLILGLIVSGVFLVSWLLAKPDKNEEFAAYYKQTLDRNYPPCDNFYKFACTNLRREYAKENEDRFDTMAMMAKSARLSLDELLTKPLNSSDSALLREMKTFHQMCINKTKVDAEGIEPVLDLLKEIGGWPLLSNEWENTETWLDIVGKVNRAGFASQFPYYLRPGRYLSLAPILDDQHPRVLPDETRTLEYVKHVATLLHATNDELDDDVKECIAFESELYEVATSVAKKTKSSTPKNLTAEFPEISWDSFFQNVFVSTPMEVSGNASIYFTHAEYNSRISELLTKTAPKTIRNYIVWGQIERAIPLMPEEFRDAKKVFEQRLVGQSRNLDCVDTLIERAELSTGYFYVESSFDDGSTKNMSRAIMKSVKSQADLFLSRIDWMDNDTQSRIIEAIERLKMILPHATDGMRVMEQLEFRSNDTTFANYRRLASAHRDSKYGRLDMSAEEDVAAVPMQYALQADAYYSTAWNTMFVLAAMFQRPVFSAAQPMYLNYGGIGFVVAHEITHALKIRSVCSNDTCPSRPAFRDRTDCMEKLYGEHVLDQINETVDGKKTAEENIGDLIGLQLAYRAYEAFARDSEESGLPGFDYTPRQWFWINVATFFCSFETDAGLRKYMADEVHSPAEARVNVAFANIDEFSRDFECRNGSRMNATRKCAFE